MFLKNPYQLCSQAENQLMVQDPMTIKQRLGYGCLVEAGYVDLTAAGQMQL